MLFLDVINTNVLLRQPIKKDGLFRQPIAGYETAKRTYDFVMTYVGHCTIKMTLVMLFLVGNEVIYVCSCFMKPPTDSQCIIYVLTQRWRIFPQDV